MAKRTCILRPADPDESGRLLEAIKKWDDKYVLPRPEADLKAAAEAGLFFVLTDEDDREILATSAVFSLREGEYVEAGTTFVDEQLRGFRLQEIFFRIRIATTVWSEGTSIKITTAIDPTNELSLKSMRRCGFRTMSDPIEEQLAPCVTCDTRPAIGAGRACCCDFYVLPDEAARAAVQAFLGQVDRGVTALRNGKGEEIELRVNAKVATDPDARTALVEYVAGKTW